jgi:hypothetical protein
MGPVEPGRTARITRQHRWSQFAAGQQGRYCCYPGAWFPILLGLLALTMLACTLPGRSEPEAAPTLTPSATAVEAPSATPSPRPTQPPTPTIAPTPRVSPTLRSVAPTAPPTPEPTTPPAAVETQPPSMPVGVNLLTNPSFEGPYEPKGGQEMKVPEGWIPWHFEWADTDFPPEFKPAEAPYLNNVHSGQRALQYFKTWGTYHAGVYQKVAVTPGVKLRFTLYGKAWSRDDAGDCPPELSCNPADMGMRIGIDPLGGSNPRAGSMVWSVQQSPIDQWVLFSVEAVAESDIVSVFAWSSPSAPRRNQDTYWDDATLEAVR